MGIVGSRREPGKKRVFGPWTLVKYWLGTYIARNIIDFHRNADEERLGEESDKMRIYSRGKRAQGGKTEELSANYNASLAQILYLDLSRTAFGI